MLPQKAQVLAGSRPAQDAEGLLLRGRDDDVDAPDLAGRRAEVAEEVIMPASKVNVPDAVSCDAQFRLYALLRTHKACSSGACPCCPDIIGWKLPRLGVPLTSSSGKGGCLQGSCDRFPEIVDSAITRKWM